MNGSDAAIDSAIEVVRGQATEVARGWSPPGAPASWALTAALFGCLAEDDELLALAARIPASRLPALLFAAAVCHLVAERRPPGLVDYFPSAGSPGRPPDGRFPPAVAAFCLGHRSELLDRCERRRYQMNEVARSTQVALALAALARRTGASEVALIDVGAGAGLGLHLDRYAHRVGHYPRFGDPASPLALDCELDGTGPVSPMLPAIAWRVGVDLDPLDLADPADRAWARACIPPEVEALTRFDRASEVARSHPCRIVPGDALDLLPALLDEVPGRLLPVVVDTFTAVFFTDEERARLRRLLGRRGASRRLAWISLDPLVPLGTAGTDSVQGLDVPPELVARYQHEGVFALLGLLTFDRGRQTGVLLGRAHPSGTRLAWFDHPDQVVRGGPG